MRRIVSFAIILILFLIFVNSFISYFTWLNSKSGLAMIFKNRWDLSLLSIIFFSSFILLLRFNKPANWYSSGIYVAFIISLFIEMYGFPLTIYFTSNYFGIPQQQNFVFDIDIYGQSFGVSESTIFGITITVIGIILVVIGWKEIYKNKNKLTKTGIYRFSRHPQYLGILLISFGWVVGWPTFLTFIFWPILLFAYYKQAKKEDEFLAKKFGKAFFEYEKRTGLFI